MLQKLGQQQATEIPKQAAGTSWVVGSGLAAKDLNERQNTPRQKSDNGYWRKAVNSNKARKARVKESVKYRPFNSLPSSSCQESRFRHKPAMHMVHSASRQAQKLSTHIKSNKELRNLFDNITWLLTSRGQRSAPCCSSLIKKKKPTGSTQFVLIYG